MYTYVYVHVYCLYNKKTIYIYIYVYVYFVPFKAFRLGSDPAEGSCTAYYLRHETSGDLKRVMAHGAMAHWADRPIS